MELTWGRIDAMLDGSVAEPSSPQADRFFADPTVGRLIDAVARRHCIAFGVRIPDYGDDIRSEITLVALLTITDPEWASRARKFKDYPTALHFLGRARVAAYTESPRYTGMGQTSTAVRRNRALATFRARMVAEYGRQPTVSELIAAFNEEMRSRRADPSRQAMIATPADLDEPWSPSAWLDPVDGLVRGDVDGDDLFEPATHDEYPVLAPTARHLIAAILDATDQVGGLTDLVARAWLGQAARSERFAPDTEIAAALGLDLDTVVDRRREVVAVAVDILRAHGMPV